ncbi:MAG: hypothetical protein AABZ08_09980 [Planctomycetota bacterium]
MQAHRKLLLALSILIVVGSLGWTTSYALHQRSESFRLEMSGKLSKFFELPCTIGRIRGHTFSSRLFEDVDIRLPQSRGRVFHCKSAIWQEHDEGGQDFNELALVDGELILGSDEWAKSDYRQVLESGLDHDFEELRLRRVSLEKFEIAFDRRGFVIRCRETAGSIDMSNPGDGVATLNAFELNGVRIGQGVRILARFKPKRAIEVNEIRLDLPMVPLTTLGIVPQIGTIKSGSFAGSLTYVNRPDAAEVGLRGELNDVDLSELTTQLPTGPLHGTLSINVDRARLVNGAFTDLRGRGRVEGLLLSSLAPLLNLPSLEGKASLRLESIDLRNGNLARLDLSGALTGLSVDEWLMPIGRGRATGRLAIRINNLELAEDSIKSADIELTLKPLAESPGTIDRELLLTAAEKALQFSWPSALPKEILPQKVPYVECGVRLLVKDNELRILGTHGPNRDTILTISVFGKPFGIVKEQRGTIDLSPWIDQVLTQARDYSADDLRDWWQSAGSRSTGN